VTAITSRTVPPAALCLLYIVGYSRLQFSDDKIKHVALSSVLPYYEPCLLRVSSYQCLALFDTASGVLFLFAR
jgi:hypothetical protein